MPESAGPVAIVLSDDLLFSSKITATGRSLGLELKTVAAATQLEALVRQQRPPCVILDLANPSLRVAELVAALRQSSPPPFIVAYGSHVDTATLRAAREAGCDLVLPRSKFAEELADALPRWTGQV